MIKQITILLFKALVFLLGWTIQLTGNLLLTIGEAFFKHKK
jgi:hypothetical protein